jgi:Tol biopolymer transport system component
LFSLGGWIDPLYATVTADGKKWMTGAYMVRAGGGEPERLPLPHSNVAELTISVKGDKIAYSKTSVSMSIWKITLPNPRTPASKFIASQSLDAGGDFSPDGSKIAFASARDGFWAIWICNADGSDPIRLTTLHTGGSPAWSRDGTHIIFDNRISGHSHLYSIKVDDHAVEQLTEGDFDDVTPAWSADGKSIYFSSDRSGKWEVWRVSSASEQLSQVTRRGGTFPQESSDGKFVYYSKGRDWKSSEVWRTSSAGGLEELVTREPSNDWRVRPEGIYFTGSGAEELVTREPGNDRRVSAEGIYLIGASDKTSTSYPVLKLFSFAMRRAKIVVPARQGCSLDNSESGYLPRRPSSPVYAVRRSQPGDYGGEGSPIVRI